MSWVRSKGPLKPIAKHLCDAEISSLLLELYLSVEDFQATADLLDELCSTETDPVIIGQYYAQLATLYRDELGDPDSALDFLSLTLDANFNHIPAFEAIVEILEERETWTELVDQYTEMIQRTEELGFLLKARLEDAEERVKAATAAPAIDVPKAVVFKSEESKPSPAVVEPEAEPEPEPEPSVVETPVAQEEAAPAVSPSTEPKAEEPQSESQPALIPPPPLTEPENPEPPTEVTAPAAESAFESQIVDQDNDVTIPSMQLEPSAATEPLEEPKPADAELRDEEAETAESRVPEPVLAAMESEPAEVQQAESADGELDDSENPFLSMEKSTPDYQGELLKEIAQKEADGDWKAVIAAMASLLETMPEKQHKFTILKKIGGIYHEHLKDRKKAVEAYREALEQSTDHDLLEKLLEIYITTTDYEPAMEILPQLIAVEPDEKKLADHHFTLAVLFRDQKNDNESALLNYNLTLDHNPRKLQAFESIDRLLTREGDWDRLTASYRNMIERVIGREDHMDLLFTLYRNLGEIYRTRLRDIPEAINAFESAIAMQPESLKIRKILCQLLDLQSRKDPSFLDRAARQHHALLLQKPEHTDSYKALCKIYFLQKSYDRAWCVCNVLHAFQQGDLNQHNFFLEHRLAGLPKFKHPLTQNDFDQLFVPKEINPHVGQILSLVGPAIQSKNAPPLKQFVKKKQRVDLNADTQLAQTASQALEMINLGFPDVYVSDKVAHCEIPFARDTALIIGETAQTWEPKALGFLIGFNSVFLRPEYYLASTGNKSFLANCVYAALHKASPDFQMPMDDETQAIRSRLDTLSDQQVKALERVVGKLMSAGGKLNLTKWLNHLDLIGIRLGLLVCADFEMALSVISQSNVLRFLSVELATQELARFISSLNYLGLREKMGLLLITDD